MTPATALLTGWKYLCPTTIRKDTMTTIIATLLLCLLLLALAWVRTLRRQIDLCSKEVENSKNSLYSLLEKTPCPCQTLDEKGCIMYVNQAWLETMGYQRSEVIGEFFGTFMQSRSTNRFNSFYSSLKESGLSTELELDMVTKTGTTINAAFESSIESELDGTFKFAHCAFKDVSKWKQAEDNLRKNERLLQKIFDLIPAGIWLADRDGNILRGNPAAIAMWGVEAQASSYNYSIFSARRLPAGTPVADDDWAVAHALCEGITTTGELLEIDALDGVTRTIINGAAPIMDEQDNLLGAVIFNQDITDRVQSETEREKQLMELAQSQKMESAERLAGGIAHDFSTMLMSILGYAELCRDTLPAEQTVRQWLDQIITIAQHSTDTIKQLQAFSSQQHINPEVLNLNTAIDNVLHILRPHTGEKIHLVWEPNHACWPVKLDPSQIERIFTNLVVNAREAIADTGTLTIEIKNQSITPENIDAYPRTLLTGDYVIVSVSDTGKGMDEMTKAHIFEPFFTTKDKDTNKGTGLGLATVYGIVKQNHGIIDVTTAPDEGSTFHIYLPRAGDVPPNSSSANQPETAYKPIKSTAAKTILLVEDEPTVRLTTEEFLKDLGYRILIAATPEEAWTIASADNDIQLLITDVMMAGMSGYELAKQLTRQHPDLSVLFISGYTADFFADEGMIIDERHFLNKPFSRAALTSKVRDILPL